MMLVVVVVVLSPTVLAEFIGVAFRVASSCTDYCES